jgi:hypothetical protein
VRGDGVGAVEAGAAEAGSGSVDVDEGEHLNVRFVALGVFDPVAEIDRVYALRTCMCGKLRCQCTWMRIRQ